MSDIQPIFLAEERALPATVSLRVSGAKFKEARHVIAMGGALRCRVCIARVGWPESLNHIGFKEVEIILNLQW
jgi:hypothetical protein